MTFGQLFWVLEMESSETGVTRGQFGQSWAGYEDEVLRLRVQTYANGKIVVYPFNRDESSTDIVWALPASTETKESSTCSYMNCDKSAIYRAHSTESERYCCGHKTHLRWAVQRLLINTDSVTVDKWEVTS